MKWLVDMWEAYKGVILPMLLSVVGIGGSFLIVYVRNVLAKTLVEKFHNNNILNKVYEKIETSVSKEEVAELKDNLKRVTNQIVIGDEQNKMLAEMIKVAFEGTALNPDTKGELSAIYNKVLYKTDEAIVDVLESKLKLANDKIVALEQKMNAPVVVEEDKPEDVKRVRV